MCLEEMTSKSDLEYRAFCTLIMSIVSEKEAFAYYIPSYSKFPKAYLDQYLSNEAHELSHDQLSRLKKFIKYFKYKNSINLFNIELYKGLRAEGFPSDALTLSEMISISLLESVQSRIDFRDVFSRLNNLIRDAKKVLRFKKNSLFTDLVKLKVMCFSFINPRGNLYPSEKFLFQLTNRLRIKIFMELINEKERYRTKVA